MGTDAHNTSENAMRLKQTYTYVELELSPAAYNEISSKLVEAGYGHAFQIGHEHGDAIDMHGIAVTMAKADGR
jgi:hypothetical protein